MLDLMVMYVAAEPISIVQKTILCRRFSILTRITPLYPKSLQKPENIHLIFSSSPNMKYVLICPVLFFQKAASGSIVLSQTEIMICHMTRNQKILPVINLLYGFKILKISLPFAV